MFRVHARLKKNKKGSTTLLRCFLTCVFQNERIPPWLLPPPPPPPSSPPSLLLLLTIGQTEVSEGDTLDPKWTVGWQDGRRAVKGAAAAAWNVESPCQRALLVCLCLRYLYLPGWPTPGERKNGVFYCLASLSSKAGEENRVESERFRRACRTRYLCCLVIRYYYPSSSLGGCVCIEPVNCLRKLDPI